MRGGCDNIISYMDRGWCCEEEEDGDDDTDDAVGPVKGEILGGGGT